MKQISLRQLKQSIISEVIPSRLVLLVLLVMRKKVFLFNILKGLHPVLTNLSSLYVLLTIFFLVSSFQHILYYCQPNLQTHYYPARRPCSNSPVSHGSEVKFLDPYSSSALIIPIYYMLFPCSFKTIVIHMSVFIQWVVHLAKSQVWFKFI